MRGEVGVWRCSVLSSVGSSGWRVGRGFEAGEVQTGRGEGGIQDLARPVRHPLFRAGVAGAVGIGRPQVVQGRLAGAVGEELGHVAGEHLDAGVDLAVQGGLVAQHPVQLGQRLVLGQRRVLEELGLPAVEAAQPPGGGGDLLDVVPFEQVLGASWVVSS